jgi:hypothetical protein
MRHFRTRTLFTLLTSTLAVTGMTEAPRAEAQDAPKFEVYGFGMLDYIQDFNRVDPAWAATLRASKIPTADGQFGSNGQAIVSARQSRLGAQANLPTDNGDVYVKFEFDMFGVGVDAGQTTIRLRHAYGQWKGWLAGQTNSVFMDVDLFPNVIDYWGPAGMVFFRNPQLRYTATLASGNLVAIAIENPGNDVDTGQLREIDPSLAVTAKSGLPDLTAHFRSEQKWGHVQVAGIARRLGYDTPGVPNNNPQGTKFGGGVDLSAVLKFAQKDKLMLGAVLGNGIASYMNDGGTDLAADGTLANPSAKAVPLQGYIAYIDHYWNEKFSSSAGYSRTQVNNTSLQTGGAFKSGDYASVNVIYYPTKKVFFGAEGLWGQRTDKSDAKGVDKRVQISAHYDFSSLDFLK